MNSEAYLTDLLEAIQAVPGENVKQPGMPVATFVQEAEDLARWSADDAAELAKAGLSAEALAGLTTRAEALKEAQAGWQRKRRSEHLWNKKLPLARSLRDALLRDCRYAFRKHQSLMSRLAAIRKGSSHADLIQDLNDLAVMAREQLPLLTAIGVEATKPDQAATMSDEMAQLLAGFHSEKKGVSPDKRLRDQAYAYLKELVDEVRLCGQYVFHDSPDRLKGYFSTYVRRRNLRHRHKSPKNDALPASSANA